MSEKDVGLQESEQIAFVVVRLGKRTNGDVLDLMCDVGEAIDAVEGCEMESCGAFPESVRPKVMRYVEAAKQAAGES